METCCAKDLLVYSDFLLADALNQLLPCLQPVWKLNLIKLFGKLRLWPPREPS